jgi:SP family myo-inositol transporter-like MFS transporter 13
MNDAAAEPLISNTRDDPNDTRDRYDDGGEEDIAEEVDGEVDESALVSPGAFIWALTVCAGVSGLLFGYEYVSLSLLITPLHCTNTLSPAPA